MSILLFIAVDNSLFFDFYHFFSRNIIVKLVNQLVDDSSEDHHKGYPHVEIGSVVEVVDTIENGQDFSSCGYEWKHMLLEIYYHVVNANLPQNIEGSHQKNVRNDLFVGEAEVQRRN